ncbi:MAG: HAMP domain-containing histidine kinase [Patescibacteria group bacterium]|nr:HAMP domain-containing histidine kinase [Patescibacteria group bacterium]MDE2172484.1 HAMP domain-containing histidine kinase [Patescibacteria group bacterium]
MTYELIIGSTPILSGSILVAGLAIVIIALLLAALANVIWKKLHEDENMKYEFITIIAHKFRTPLTTVKWLLENMLNDETDPQRRENFMDMKTSNEKLIALTGTLIELTNLDDETKSSYSFEKVSLCEFAKSVAEGHKDIFHEKNIFFSVQCPDPNALVSIDRPRMEFVLQTLFENACNYTPVGRNVDVYVGSQGGKAVLAVTDHGIGIDRADLPKIFTKFYRAANARSVDTEGFGVGLYLAQSITKHLGGRITASSAGIGQGATFTLTLPLARR